MASDAGQGARPRAEIVSAGLGGLEAARKLTGRLCQDVVTALLISSIEQSEVLIAVG